MRNRTVDKGSIVTLARFQRSGQPPTLLEQAMLSSFTDQDLGCAHMRRLLLNCEKKELADVSLVERVHKHYWTCPSCAVLYVAMPLADKVGTQRNDEQIAARLVGILLNIYLLGREAEKAVEILLAWTRPIEGMIMMGVLMEIKNLVGDIDDEEFSNLAGCIKDYSSGSESGSQGARTALKEILPYLSPEHQKKLLP